MREPASQSPQRSHICDCVHEMESTWAALRPDRICLAGVAMHLHARRACDRCGGTGIVQAVVGVAFDPEYPDLGASRSITLPVPAEKAPEPPTYYASVGSEKDGRPFLYEAEAPTAQEACDLLYMIQAGPGDAAARERETNELLERERDDMAGEIATLKAELGAMRETAETMWKNERRAIFGEAGSIPQMADKTNERAELVEQIAALKGELAIMRKARADATEAHSVAEAKRKLDLDDYRNTLSGVIAVVVSEGGCFPCGVPDRAHSPGCPIGAAEHLLERWKESRGN